jgi:DNA-binding GntR family transcriptional regulator
MSEALLRKTLPEQIYQILREDILHQKIPCGAKLPLQTLKERFGVSHTPIREALTRLVEDGLVNYYSNVGVSVISLDKKDVREIFELSYDFDWLAIEYALAAGRRGDFLSALNDNLRACGLLLRNNNIEAWGAASDGFHLAFYRYAGNSRLETASTKLRAQLTLLYNMNRIEKHNWRQIQDYHDQIHLRLCENDTQGAREALRLHIYGDMALAIKNMKTRPPVSQKYKGAAV